MSSQTRDANEIKASHRFKLVALLRLLGLVDGETAKAIVADLADRANLQKESQLEVLCDLLDEQVLESEQLLELQEFCEGLSGHISSLVAASGCASPHTDPKQSAVGVAIAEAEPSVDRSIQAKQASLPPAASLPSPPPMQELDALQTSGRRRQPKVAPKGESQAPELNRESPREADGGSADATRRSRSTQSESQRKRSSSRRRRRPDYEGWHESWDSKVIRILRDSPEAAFQALGLGFARLIVWARDHWRISTGIVVTCLLLLWLPALWSGWMGSSEQARNESSVGETDEASNNRQVALTGDAESREQTLGRSNPPEVGGEGIGTSRDIANPQNGTERAVVSNEAESILGSAATGEKRSEIEEVAEGFVGSGQSQAENNQLAADEGRQLPPPEAFAVVPSGGDSLASAGTAADGESFPTPAAFESEQASEVDSDPSKRDASRSTSLPPSEIDEGNGNQNIREQPSAASVKSEIAPGDSSSEEASNAVVPEPAVKLIAPDSSLRRDRAEELEADRLSDAVRAIEREREKTDQALRNFEQELEPLILTERYDQAINLIRLFKKRQALSGDVALELEQIWTALLLAKADDKSQGIAGERLVQFFSMDSYAWRLNYATWLMQSTKDTRNILLTKLQSTEANSAIWKERLIAWLKSRDEHTSEAIDILGGLDAEICDPGDFLYRALARMISEDVLTARSDIQLLLLQLNRDLSQLDILPRLAHQLSEKRLRETALNWAAKLSQKN